MEDKVGKERAYLHQTNFSCGFCFEGSEASLSVFAPTAAEAGEILRTLLAFKKVRQVLGDFEVEKTK